MRIYLSGPITNIPDLNRPAFDAAEKRLAAQGHFVINPHRISELFGSEDELAKSFGLLYNLPCSANQPPWDHHIDIALACAVMDADLAAVRSCDAIYLLRGWENSRGAKKELAEAIACKLQVMLEDEAAPVEQIKVQETTAEATCPRGETTNMGCVFCYDGVVCSETNEVCPYYNKEEES